MQFTVVTESRSSSARPKAEFVAVGMLRKLLFRPEAPKLVDLEEDRRPDLAPTETRSNNTAVEPISSESALDAHDPTAPDEENNLGMPDPGPLGSASQSLEPLANESSARIETGEQRSNEGANSMGEESLSAVAKMFQSTKVFEEKLARLRSVFDQADTFGGDAMAAFEAMVKLAQSLGKLAEPYRSVKAFQSEMANLAGQFEQISGVQKIFRDVSENLRDQLKAVASALEPAKKLQTRLAQLTRALEPAFDLQAQFQELAEVFSPPAPAPSESELKGKGEAVHSSEAPLRAA